MHSRKSVFNFWIHIAIYIWDSTNLCPKTMFLIHNWEYKFESHGLVYEKKLFSVQGRLNPSIWNTQIQRKNCTYWKKQNKKQPAYRCIRQFKQLFQGSNLILSRGLSFRKEVDTKVYTTLWKVYKNMIKKQTEIKRGVKLHQKVISQVQNTTHPKKRPH